MRILRALEIAKREWRNIGFSLEKFGDIGEFDSKNHVDRNFNLLSEGSPLVRNLIEMDNKLQKHVYLTQEAAYVFTSLASKAGERLGLMIRLTQTFGRGYGWVRTGWFNPSDIEKEYVIKQLFFFKIFFPLGGYFNWYFDSPEVKTKLKAILHKFAGWQDDPRSYIEDVKRFKDQLEPLWKGLSWTLDISTADRSERYKISFLLNCALGSMGNMNCVEDLVGLSKNSLSLLKNTSGNFQTL